MNNNKRDIGILLHPTSLPSKDGIGNLGKNAYLFIDKLRKSKIGYWQILPIGPTGFGDSPYASRSSFAGNELLIDLETLYNQELLELEDILLINEKNVRVDYAKAREIKMPLLKKAALKFLDNTSEEYDSFVKNNALWLDDYALFQVLCDEYNDSRWYLSWPENIRKREKKEIEKIKKLYADKIALFKVYQFFFYSQWMKMKAYANSNNVKIIGDIPIFVAFDSADAWSSPHLLKLDEEFNQEALSGVPPDGFSTTGQLWGNPLYKWQEHEKDNFSWWTNRLGAVLKQCDIVRIDHFIGFNACYEIEKGSTNGINGTWVKAPGQKILNAFKEKFGSDLPIIAEDLGILTKEVETLRDDNNLSGMKVLQFAFGFDNGKFDSSNFYLPHNIGSSSIVYTGTHDNDTTLSWYFSQDERTKDVIRRYLECPDDDIVYKIIRAALSSNAKLAVIPFQDVLALGGDARMNLPSTCGTLNWSWKMTQTMLDDDNFARLKYYIELYQRESV